MNTVYEAKPAMHAVKSNAPLTKVSPFWPNLHATHKQQTHVLQASRVVTCFTACNDSNKNHAWCDPHGHCTVQRVPLQHQSLWFWHSHWCWVGGCLAWCPCEWPRDCAGTPVRLSTGQSICDHEKWWLYNVACSREIFTNFREPCNKHVGYIICMYREM